MSSEVKNTTELQKLESELDRVNYNKRLRKVFRSTITTLIVVAAVAVLVAVLFMPVLRIYGNSMSPTLKPGDIIVSFKGVEPEVGDVVGVYYGSKLLIKRCIATSGQWVDINDEGDVYVEGKLLEEPYLKKKAYGLTNIKLPYQVPANAIFVMGDHRETSVDSRNTSVGCIDSENVVGKVVFRIWPLNRVGLIK